MARTSNPRFPHTCRIIRFINDDPMIDQAKDDDPMSDDPMFDESEESDTVEEVDESTKGAVIYEGKCRSDNRATTSDNGEYNVSFRTLALPQKQDEWTEGTIPLEGDRIELKRFGYIEYGLIVDIRPSNLGTHILWRHARN